MRLRATWTRDLQKTSVNVFMLFITLTRRNMTLKEKEPSMIRAIPMREWGWELLDVMMGNFYFR